MPPVMIDPVRIFQVNGEVCQLLCSPKTLTVANNHQIVAAVAGKKIRVMGWLAQSTNAAIGAFLLKDGSAGTTIVGSHGVPLFSAAGQIDKLPIVDCGYAETTVSVGLYADCTVDIVGLDLFYIAYTPA